MNGFEALVAVLVLVVVVVVVAAWLSWTASRLDQLHHRVDLAHHALTQALLRRSGITSELAHSGALDPAASLVLADVAHAAGAGQPGPAEPRTQATRRAEQAESDLSEALRAVLADPDEVARLRADSDVGDLVLRLADVSRKVEMARRFHNDQVSSARALRSRRRVRWLRLAGHAVEPVTVDLDDAPPPALVALLPGGSPGGAGRRLGGP